MPELLRGLALLTGQAGIGWQGERKERERGIRKGQKGNFIVVLSSSKQEMNIL
jgi:hypothetical protein